MPSFKSILWTFVIAVVAIAVVSRVSFVRGIVQGA